MWIGVTYDTMRVARCVYSLYIEAFTTILYAFLQDSCEQLEWRLLLGTRDPAWDVLLFKTAPGACWYRTLYMPRLILLAS